MALVMTSCGKNGYSGQESYDFTENYCSTGEHVFKSKKNQSDLMEQYCEALQNNELNQHCALSLRHFAFQSKCEPLGFVWAPF